MNSLDLVVSRYFDRINARKQRTSDFLHAHAKRLHNKCLELQKAIIYIKRSGINIISKMIKIHKIKAALSKAIQSLMTFAG